MIDGCFDSCDAFKVHTYSGCLESMCDRHYTCKTWATFCEDHQVTGAKRLPGVLWEAKSVWFPLGGTWVQPSGRCVFLMLDETWWQSEPGGDPAVEAIRSQRDVPPFGKEQSIAPPERNGCQGQEAWPRRNGHRVRKGGGGAEHRHMLHRSQWKLNKQAIYQSLSALTSTSLSNPIILLGLPALPGLLLLFSLHLVSHFRLYSTYINFHCSAFWFVPSPVL